MIRWPQLIKKVGDAWQPTSKYNAMVPFTLSIDPDDVRTLPVTITTAAQNVGFQAPRISDSGGFEGNLLMFEDSTAGTAAANWLTQFVDRSGRALSNQPCHVRTVFGTAQLPAYCREPLVLFSREKAELMLDMIAGTSTGRVNIGGVAYNPTNVEQQKFIIERVAKWEERRKYVWPFWFTTEISPVVLTALQTNANFDVRIGEHFEAFSMSFVSTGEFQLAITEVRSGKTLCNGQFDSAGAMDSATFPWIFDRPYMIPKGSRLRFTFTDVSGAPNSIFVTIAGRKIVNVPFKDIPSVLKDTDVNRDTEDMSVADFYSGVKLETVDAQ